LAMKSCTAVAPSSTSNLGPGYDVFGLALSPLQDRVKIIREPGRSRRITIKNVGERHVVIPCKVESNAAGREVEPRW